MYATCVNNSLKWFPDKRGLAVGLTAAGYGSGTILTIIPIANMIATHGYQAAFFTFGLIQGAVIFLFAWFLRAPRPGVITYSAKVAQSRRDYTLAEALRTPVFWVMLVMFTGTVTGGLMAVAQLSVIAEDLGVRDIQINFYFFTMAALPFALMMNTIVNGLSRPLFGGLSDHIGREMVMFIAFSLEAMGILALGWYGSNPWAFVVLSGLVFFAWGEVYSLFSATAGDTFGTKHIGKIYGLLYCAKGVAALLVPFGNLLMEATGSWTSVLYTMAALDLGAALAAILILRPMRRRYAQADGRAGRSAEVGPGGGVNIGVTVPDSRPIVSRTRTPRGSRASARRADRPARGRRRRPLRAPAAGRPRDPAASTSCARRPFPRRPCAGRSRSASRCPAFRRPPRFRP